LRGIVLTPRRGHLKASVGGDAGGGHPWPETAWARVTQLQQHLELAYSKRCRLGNESRGWKEQRGHTTRGFCYKLSTASLRPCPVVTCDGLVLSESDSDSRTRPIPLLNPSGQQIQSPARVRRPRRSPRLEALLGRRTVSDLPSAGGGRSTLQAAGSAVRNRRSRPVDRESVMPTSKMPSFVYGFKCIVIGDTGPSSF
jgi:hypothetical protein